MQGTRREVPAASGQTGLGWSIIGLTPVHTGAAAETQRCLGYTREGVRQSFLHTPMPQAFI